MIYSIGHGGTTLDNVGRLMRELHIMFLVDVRSKPFSRWQPQFNKRHLAEQLANAYLWRPDLGGLDGNVISEESLTWLAELGGKQNILIMCSEGDFNRCHRHSKIAARLWNRTPPVPVIHISREGNQTPAFREGEVAPMPADQPRVPAFDRTDQEVKPVEDDDAQLSIFP